MMRNNHPGHRQTPRPAAISKIKAAVPKHQPMLRILYFPQSGIIHIFSIIGSTVCADNSTESAARAATRAVMIQLHKKETILESTDTRGSLRFQLMNSISTHNLFLQCYNSWWSEQHSEETREPESADMEEPSSVQPCWNNLWRYWRF